MADIILASGSLRRKKLLQKINLSFRVHPSSADEAFDPNLSANEIVCNLALRKSKEVAGKFSNALVIGADTIVTFEDEILEKPADDNEARQMLKKLSGQMHQVYTGVALCKVSSSNNITNTKTFWEKTDVMFGNLSLKVIDDYIDSKSPLDKAGGYGIQDDFGAISVKNIKGDYYNVVGFPLHRFYTALSEFAPNFLPNIG